MRLGLQCVCAIAQYAVYLIGEAKIRTHPSKILNQFEYRFKISLLSSRESIFKAVTVLRMREQNAFLCGFFVNISIAAFVVDTGHSFEPSIDA